MDNNLNNIENVEISQVKESIFVSKVRKRLTLMGLLSVLILTGVATILTVPQVIMMTTQIAAGEPVSQNLLAALLLTVGAELITIFIALWVVWGLKDWKNLLMLKNFKWKSVFLGFGIGLVLFVLLQVISNLFEYFGATVESSDTSVGLANLSGWQSFIALGILTPFIVPFIEELFFRGYVLNFMRNGVGSGKKRLYWAIAVSAFYFSIMHFQGLSTINDVVLLVWIGLIAVVNALLVIRYDSLYPAVAVHVGYNGITSLIMVLASSLV